jgi:hypothetical protein
MKIQQSVVYKKPTVLTEINTGLGRKVGRKFTKPMPPKKKTGVAIIISEKLHVKVILFKRDKEGHFILIKGAIHQEEITIINLYAPNVSVPNIIEHTLKDLKITCRPQHSVSGRL